MKWQPETRPEISRVRPLKRRTDEPIKVHERVDYWDPAGAGGGCFSAGFVPQARSEADAMSGETGDSVAQPECSALTPLATHDSGDSNQPRTFAMTG